MIREGLNENMKYGLTPKKMKKQAICFLRIDHSNRGSGMSKCRGAGMFLGVYGTRKPAYKRQRQGRG